MRENSFLFVQKIHLKAIVPGASFCYISCCCEVLVGCTKYNNKVIVENGRAELSQGFEKDRYRFARKAVFQYQWSATSTSAFCS